MEARKISKIKDVRKGEQEVEARKRNQQQRKKSK